MAPEAANGDASPSASVPFPGDSAQRMVVNYPQSFGELNRHGVLKFHRVGAPARYFHKGRTPIMNGGQLASKVRPGDVVVVVKDDGPQAKFDEMTTHQADYVKHPIAPQVPFKMMRPQTPTHNRFEGMSEYDVRYIKHDMVPASRIPPPKAMWDGGRARDGETGKSNYAEQYRWHDPEPARQQKPVVAAVAAGQPFQGISSYQTDYVQHPMRPRSAARVKQSRAEAAGPFQGVSTYAMDFQGLPGERNLQSLRPQNVEASPSHPFQGASEYQTVYVPKESERPILLLEPVLKTAQQRPASVAQQRPASASATRSTQQRRPVSAGPTRARRMKMD